MIRTVLDTNVLVSAVISPTGPSAQLLELVVADQIRPYVTNAVIEEYDRVFDYERLKHLDHRRVAVVSRLLKNTAITVKSPGRLRLSEDEADNRSYECALAAKAHYIVTGNTKDFPLGHKYTKIVTARQLLRLLEK